jgi:hypothetical protein
MSERTRSAGEGSLVLSLVQRRRSAADARAWRAAWRAFRKRRSTAARPICATLPVQESDPVMSKPQRRN